MPKAGKQQSSWLPSEPEKQFSAWSALSNKVYFFVALLAVMKPLCLGDFLFLKLSPKDKQALDFTT